MKGLLQWIQHRWQPLTGCLAAVITLSSLWPAAQLPDLPGSDKIHHLISYALLMLPTALARPPHWIGLMLLYLGWSGAIELIQPYVNRYGEWLDLLANAAGLLLGVLIGAGLRHYLRLNQAPQ